MQANGNRSAALQDEPPPPYTEVAPPVLFSTPAAAAAPPQQQQQQQQHASSKPQQSQHTMYPTLGGGGSSSSVASASSSSAYPGFSGTMYAAGPPLPPRATTTIPPTMPIQQRPFTIPPTLPLPQQQWSGQAQNGLPTEVANHVGTLLNSTSNHPRLRQLVPAPTSVRIPPCAFPSTAGYIVHYNDATGVHVLSMPMADLTITALPLLPLPAGYTFVSFMAALIAFVHMPYPNAHRIDTLRTEHTFHTRNKVVFQSYAMDVKRNPHAKTTRRTYAFLETRLGVILLWSQTVGKLNFALNGSVFEAFVKDMRPAK
ncbi:hypothetical protein RI367_000267 [Sorochytrium milnesiophthora]